MIRRIIIRFQAQSFSKVKQISIQFLIRHKLEYIYDQGGHIAQMEGVIAAHEAHSHIKLEMVDKMFQVVVKFDLEPSGDGTKFTFTSAIKPLSLMAKILLPVVKATMPSQVKGDAEKLARLIEATA
jgi:hypothetical protein